MFVIRLDAVIECRWWEIIGRWEIACEQNKCEKLDLICTFESHWSTVAVGQRSFVESFATLVVSYWWPKLNWIAHTCFISPTPPNPSAFTFRTKRPFPLRARELRISLHYLWNEMSPPQSRVASTDRLKSKQTARPTSVSLNSSELCLCLDPHLKMTLKNAVDFINSIRNSNETPELGWF